MLGLGISISDKISGTPFWMQATYGAADRADGAVKGPALIFDARRNRHAVTQTAVGAISAATVAALSILRHAAPADLLAFSRASTAQFLDADGVTRSAADNLPRFDWTNGVSQLLLEAAATNLIRNNTMGGGVAGTPGTLPTNVTIPISGGLSREIVGTGVENGIDYCDIRFFGTATSSGPVRINFDGATQAPGVAGDVFTVSAYVKLAAAPLPFLNSRFRFYEYDSGVATALATSDYTIAMSGANLTRASASHTASQSGTAYVLGSLCFGITNGSPYDFTVRIGLPQMERGSVASSIIRTTGSAITRAADSGADAAKAVALEKRAAFTGIIKGRLPAVATGILFQADDGTLNKVVRLSLLSGTILLTVISGGTTVASIATDNAMSANVPFGVGFRVSGNDFAICLNGGAVISDGTGAIPVGLTRAFIGRDAGGTGFAAGHFDERLIYPFAMNNTALQAKAVNYV